MIIVISKAVILAAGEGKRLYPISHSVPKEMIKIKDKPVIQHLIEASVESGINDIQIVISPRKENIMKYFGTGDWLKARISYQIQKKPFGTADALKYSKDFIGSDPVLVIYGDMYMTSSSTLTEFVNTWEKSKTDVALCLQKVHEPEEYGLAKIDHKNRIIEVAEKPKRDVAAQYLYQGNYYAISGMIILKSSMLRNLESTLPGVNGEIWLTDTIQIGLREGLTGIGYISKNKILDVGTKEAVLIAEKTV